jgi:hypothetical protein
MKKLMLAADRFKKNQQITQRVQKMERTTQICLWLGVGSE